MSKANLHNITPGEILLEEYMEPMGLSHWLALWESRPAG